MAKASKKKAARAAHGTGIGAHAKELITKGKTNEQVLESILKKFPGAETKLSNVAWYRNNMRTEGVKGVRTNRELTAPKAAKKPAA